MRDLAVQKGMYIKKHNAAIRSYSDMTLLQRKLANTLLYHAYDDLAKKDFHQITISQLLSLLSMKTNDYPKLKQAVKQLVSTVVEWNVISYPINHQGENKENGEKKLFNSNENWQTSALLSGVHIEGTMIKYEYSRTLRELLYRPSLYSKINLSIQNRFKSGHSLALYENCLSYLNCNTTGWISIDSFRKVMGVNESKYKLFRDFNRRVLKPAVYEINKLSDINVDFEIKKAKRIPSHIKLHVRKINIKSEEVAGVNSKDNLTEKLLKYGISKEQIIWLLKGYNHRNIEEKIALMERSTTTIKTPIAYLKAALKENYGEPASISFIRNQEQSKNEDEKRTAEQKQQALQKNYTAYLENIYRDWLPTLQSENKEHLLVGMREYFESSEVVMPFWKKAKRKLKTDDWVTDDHIFMSIKIYLNVLKKTSQTILKLPEVRTFEEYLMDFS